MAPTYTTLVGAPPSPLLVKKWKDWYRTLLNFRISYCLFPRETTYYVSSSIGSDSNDGLTTTTPFQTRAKVQTVITASSGNIAFLFKRGDEWSETGGLILSKAKIYVGSYSTVLDTFKFIYGRLFGDYGSKKPLHNRFTLKYARSGWTNASGNRWTRTDANTIAWVRDQVDRLGIVYVKYNSTADVAATPLSFYYETGTTTLHINCGAGVDPNSKNLEAVIDNAESGIDLAADATAVVGNRFDGYDITRADGYNQLYGIRISTTGTDAALVYDCESYFCTVHTLSQYSTGGGFGTFVYCKTGYGRNVESTLYNFYSTAGAHETIAHKCEATYGALPDYTWLTATVVHAGSASYGHTSGGIASLVVVYGMTTKATKWGCQNGVTGFSDLPAASAITDSRCFIVNEVFEKNASSGLGFIPCPSNTVILGGKYFLRPASTGVAAFTTTGSCNGWNINCYIEVDLRSTTDASLGFFNVAGPFAPIFYNTHINVIGNSGTTDFVIDNHFGAVGLDSQSSTGQLKNCILSASSMGTKHFYVGMGNDGSARYTNNAYYGITQDSGNIRGYNTHLNQVALSSAPVPLRAAKFDSQLYQTGASLSISHDMNDYPVVTTMSIGPVSENPQNDGLNVNQELSSADQTLQVIPVAEPVNGVTTVFTVTDIPDFMLVDENKVLAAVSATGNVNWTISGLTVTLQVAPTLSVSGLKLNIKK